MVTSAKRKASSDDGDRAIVLGVWSDCVRGKTATVVLAGIAKGSSLGLLRRSGASECTTSRRHIHVPRGRGVRTGVRCELKSTRFGLAWESVGMYHQRRVRRQDQGPNARG